MGKEQLSSLSSSILLLVLVVLQFAYPLFPPPPPPHTRTVNLLVVQAVDVDAVEARLGVGRHRPIVHTAALLA